MTRAAPENVTAQWTAPTHAAVERAAPGRIALIRAASGRVAMIRATSSGVGTIHVAPGRIAMIRMPSGRVALIRVAPAHVVLIRMAPSRITKVRATPSRITKVRATPSRIAKIRAVASRITKNRAASSRISTIRAAPTGAAVIRAAGLAIALTLAIAGTGLVGAGVLRNQRLVSSAPLPPAAPTPSPLPTAAWSVAPDRPAALGRSVPVRLDIPAIGVHTALMRLALRRDGTVEVPPLGRSAPAGWYEHSVTPGEIGAAVILGHVDSARSGPAVFYRLGSLRAGNRITVRRADGSTATFVVTAAARYAKNRFPTHDVYGRLPYPGLRLITCGGSFDRSRRSYRDNVVVFARAAA